MSEITITINCYGNKYQLQFPEYLTIDALMEELHRIPILLDYTPQTMADWQNGYLYDDQAHDDILFHEMELKEKLERITAKNIFEIIAPGIRPGTCTTVTEEQLQEAIDQC